MLGNSGGDPAEGGGSSSGDVVIPSETDRSSGGGNRWPRQETAALIKLRTEMDLAFQDSSLKGPLWDEVSRKLAELGYHRSAKKCKEKFENVFKYHKRTKDGRNTKSEGKNYPFFDQLEALDSQPPPKSVPLPPLPRPQTHQAMPTMNSNTISSTQSLPQLQNPISVSFSAPAPTTNQDPPSVSSSYSTSSDREPERRRKRKWEEFFDRLTSEVMQRQEEMQKKFLEALEKREQECVAREEAWRAQEVARMSREREILAQERAVSAVKDAAVFAFLQKMSGADQQIPDQPQPPPLPELVQPTPPPQQSPQPPIPMPVPTPIQQMPQPPASAPPPPLPTPPPLLPTLPPSHLHLQMLKPKADEGGETVNFSTNPSSSRWPKAEIEALIKLRTNLDLKYQENVPKGPLWEEVSTGMLRLGYNRNPKRCKEKWENINKYYKKVKESNKKRPEESKTCPYFDQLEAIYKERAKMGPHFKQENVAAPIMAQPEQQWPVQNRPELLSMEGHDSEDDEDEENEAKNYELVTK